MASASSPAPVTARQLSRDFWMFWAGQSISALGSSFTTFALPLLIFKLTGSAIDLALASASNILPYLLFGLVIGAWTDRVNRKRLMIFTDLMRAAVIAFIPLLGVLNLLSVEWIYGVIFASSTLSIFFDSAGFAAIPSLVSLDDLVTANGRIQASYSGAAVIGPLLAGVVMTIAPLQTVLLFDALSFAISAVSLALIWTNFNAGGMRRQTNIRQDIMEGLGYVFRHPVLRNISLMMALVNFATSSIYAQIVLLAKQHFLATDSEVGFLYSAGAVGVIVLSLLAGPLRKYLCFSKVALGSLMIHGLLIALLAVTSSYGAAVVIWAVASGFGVLFNINTGSLRQAIVPNEMLGRVISIAKVLAWSAIPLGAFIGGVFIDRTGNIVYVCFAVGLLNFIIALVFSFTALGHAEHYLTSEKLPLGQGQTMAN